MIFYVRCLLIAVVVMLVDWMEEEVVEAATVKVEMVVEIERSVP